MRHDFDIDAFLQQPLVARLATAGPTIRPVWYLWEGQAFWWLTGSWSALRQQLAADPTVAIVIDICELDTGEVKQVRARGAAEIHPFQRERAYRKLSRYLGPDEQHTHWDDSRFSLQHDATTRFVKLTPDRIDALDLSFRSSSHG
jgi:nitroimidazol reductase NimA-like FMN-containing flavoprotein (pyridoxamine 5'-phosphate oxidase superfamily)